MCPFLLTMKTKFYYLFAILTVALFFVACGDEDGTPGTDGGIEISVITKETKLSTSDASSANVSFKATETWKAVSDADWCTVSPTQGTSGDSKKITVTIAENTTKNERTAHVTVKTVSGGKEMVKWTITQPGLVEKPSQDSDANAPAGMKTTAAGLVKKINVGWNLGNTCEAGIWTGWSGDDLSIETNWLSPKVKTSKAMITALKEAGFNAIRIPARWTVHADDNMKINDRWLARIKEIVDYAVSQDMYVILNSHHDNWYDRLPVGYNETEIRTKYENMWTQIATYFKDYDEHLIFAGANEIIKLKSDGSEDWGTPTDANITFANNLMQLFVNTVRATGGNNAWRCLMVQPWAASPTHALNDKFALPTDTKENRLIVEYHCYDPYHYAIGKDVKDNSYAQHEVKQSDYDNIATNFSKLNAKFVAKGIPCIMAEFGSTQDNSYSKGNDAADKIRADYHTFVVKEAKKYNIPGFYWDNYSFTGTGENFGLLDRQNCNFPDRAKIALKGIMDGLK